MTRFHIYDKLYLLELTTLLFIADQGKSFFLSFYKIGGLMLIFFYKKLENTDNIIKSWQSKGPSFKKSKDVGETMKSPSTHPEFIRILNSKAGDYNLFFRK